MDPLTSEPASLVWLLALALSLGVFVVPVGICCWLRVRAAKKAVGSSFRWR
jgi:hypothetical protein